MKKAIIAKKIGMTQVFTENGDLTPVTVLQAGPCFVSQKKTIENDGYEAVQLAFGEIKEKHLTKPLKVHFAKASIKPAKFLKEFRLDDISSYSTGSEVKADIFNTGERVDITGISKGKGYQGAIKRHNQHRGPMAHGSKFHRAVGSLSSATTPGRVKKGKKMAGHMGAKQITTQNLSIVRVEIDKDIILIKGAVPGPNGSILSVKDTVKA